MFNCSVFNCSVFNCSVFNCSVFNYSVFNCTDNVQLRWLIVIGVYHVFEKFYCLNSVQLLPAAMHGLWVDVPKTMGNSNSHSKRKLAAAAIVNPLQNRPIRSIS